MRMPTSSSSSCPSPRPFPASSAPEEAALLAGLRANDPNAYGAMVRRESGRLLATTRRILRCEEDARDAVQEAFLAAFQRIDGFQGDARFSTWLHRIAINAALMKLRSRRRKREESLEPLLPRFAEDGHHAAPVARWPRNAEQSVSDEELRRIVHEALARLPESHRTVLLLRDIEGLDTEETARALGIGVDAAKMRLHRARQALRALLEPQLAPHGDGVASF